MENGKKEDSDICRLVHAARSNSLAHGYIFFGENQEIAKSAVFELLAELEPARPARPAMAVAKGEAPPAGGPREAKGGTYLDASFISSEGKSSLGIDEVRKLKGFLAQKAFRAKRRTVVVLGAELLTREAQNALLKISEDPPPNSLIILIARREESFLPTLLSRFRRVHFPAGKNPTAGASLKKGGVEAWTKKNSSTAEEEKIVKFARDFLSGSRKERSAIIKEIVKKEEDGGVNLVKPFITALVVELRKDEIRNAGLLRALLERERLMGQFQLNGRLQLEFFSSLWYN